MSKAMPKVYWYFKMLKFSNVYFWLKIIFSQNRFIIPLSRKGIFLFLRRIENEINIKLFFKIVLKVIKKSFLNNFRII